MAAAAPVTARLAAARMSEDELQEHVRTLCRQLGLEVQHIHDSRRCWLAGWPDIEILGTAILHRELKRQGENPTPAQAKIGRRIIAAGGSWRVWRPLDLLDGTIARELTAVSPMTLVAFTAEV